MKRRQLLSAALATLAGASTAALAQSAPADKPPLLQVWKDPNCGCCGDWVTHLQASGFLVQVIDTGNIAARKRLGMPDTLGSCHTARVGGYVIEGHVPARDILRLLREKPNALGLAVPGMPIGSPGMDGPEYKGRRDPYDVLLVQRGGQTTVFQSHRS
jgi:hypothetical protein